MITIDKLKAFGADTEDGLRRCLNKEDFYLLLVNKVIASTNIDELKKAVDEKDYAKGFEIAHSLKGTYGNLSITPIYEVVLEICENLRVRREMDYSSDLLKLETKYKELKEL